MSAASIFAEATTWFAVLGAFAAVVKHGATPLAALNELTPIAVRNGQASPEALWWGGYAFFAMNVGFAANGAWALATGDRVAKQGVLLSTGALFAAFATAWMARGHLSGKAPHAVSVQATKIACFSALFLSGFAASLVKPA